MRIVILGASSALAHETAKWYAREGASFAPSGVLRLALSDEEKDEMLAVARRVLLQIKADS